MLRLLVGSSISEFLRGLPNGDRLVTGIIMGCLSQSERRPSCYGELSLGGRLNGVNGDRLVTGRNVRGGLLNGDRLVTGMYQ